MILWKRVSEHTLKTPYEALLVMKTKIHLLKYWKSLCLLFPRWSLWFLEEILVPKNYVSSLVVICRNPLRMFYSGECELSSYMSNLMNSHFKATSSHCKKIHLLTKIRKEISFFEFEFKTLFHCSSHTKTSKLEELSICVHV